LSFETLVRIGDDDTDDGDDDNNDGDGVGDKEISFTSDRNYFAFTTFGDNSFQKNRFELPQRSAFALQHCSCNINIRALFWQHLRHAIAKEICTATLGDRMAYRKLNDVVFSSYCAVSVVRLCLFSTDLAPTNGNAALDGSTCPR